MPKTTTANKGKEPQELEVESFPIITTLGPIMAWKQRHPIPDWEVEAMRIAMEQTASQAKAPRIEPPIQHDKIPFQPWLWK